MVKKHFTSLRFANIFVLRDFNKREKRSDAVDGHTSCWNTVGTFSNVIYKSNKTKNNRNKNAFRNKVSLFLKVC